MSLCPFLCVRHKWQRLVAIEILWTENIKIYSNKEEIIKFIYTFRTPSAVNYYRKMLHLRCLTRFWIRLCYMENLSDACVIWQNESKWIWVSLLVYDQAGICVIISTKATYGNAPLLSFRCKAKPVKVLEGYLRCHLNDHSTKCSSVFRFQRVVQWQHFQADTTYISNLWKLGELPLLRNGWYSNDQRQM